MKELRIAAVTENLSVVTAFVDEQLESLACSVKMKLQIKLVIDEIFSNIIRYAYDSGVGEVKVRFEVQKDPLCIELTFIDSGVPFNPLTVAEPDTGLSAEERTSGGLGIWIVRSCMDEICYHYEEERNMLTIRKRIDV